MSNPTGKGLGLNREKAEQARLAAVQLRREARLTNAIEFAKTIPLDVGLKLGVGEFRKLYRQWADPRGVLPSRTAMLPENKKLSEVLNKIFPGRQVWSEETSQRMAKFYKRNGSLGMDRRIANLESNIERIHSIVQQIRKDLVEFGIATPVPKPPRLEGQQSTIP